MAVAASAVAIPFDGHFGIDRLRTRMRASVAPEGPDWNDYCSTYSRSARIGIGPGAIFIKGSRDRRTKLWYAEVDFNPSPYTLGPGYELCDPETARHAFEEVVAASADLVRPLSEPKWATVTGLHVARNFHGLEDVSATIKAIETFVPVNSRPGHKKGYNATDGTNRAETRYIGGKTDYVAVHDKRAEMLQNRATAPHAAPEGTMRFELRATSASWLPRYAEIRTVNQINGTRVRTLMESRWTSSGADIAIVTMPLLLDRVDRLVDARGKPLSAEMKHSFVSWVMHKAAGWDPWVVKPGRLALFKRWERQLRSTLRSDPQSWLTDASPRQRRLNLITGAEEVRVVRRLKLVA